MTKSDIWQLFETQLVELFEVGYNLPVSCQVEAIDKVESGLQAWKGNLTETTQKCENFGATKEESIAKEHDTDAEVSTSTATDSETAGADITASKENRSSQCAASKIDGPGFRQSGRRKTRSKKYPEGEFASGVKLFELNRGRPKKKESPSRVLADKDARELLPTVGETTAVAVQQKGLSEECTVNIVEQSLVLDENETSQSGNGFLEEVIEAIKLEPIFHEELEEKESLPIKASKKRKRSKPAPEKASEKCTDGEKTVKKGPGRPKKDYSTSSFTLNEDDGAKKHSCETCGKSFRSAIYLRSHMKLHVEGPIVCPHEGCKRKYTSRAGFLDHVKVHTDDCFRCDQCAAVFGCKTRLDKHKLTHEKDQESLKVHLCDICAKGFTTHGQLKRHVIAIHVREKNYPCPHCEYKAHSSDLISHHIRNMHIDRDPYICNICGAACKYKSNLIDHQNRHFGEKKFQCNECPYAAVSAKDIYRHQHIHKPPQFKCDMCGKAFRMKEHLRRHKLTHTGEKDFSCSYCTYKCNVSSNLRKHVQNVHRIQPEKVLKRVLRIDDLKVEPDIKTFGDEPKNVNDDQESMEDQDDNERYVLVEKKAGDEDFVIVQEGSEVIDDKSYIIVKEQESAGEKQGVLLDSGETVPAEEYLLVAGDDAQEQYIIVHDGEAKGSEEQQGYEEYLGDPYTEDETVVIQEIVVSYENTASAENS